MSRKLRNAAILNENSWKNSSRSCPDPFIFRSGFDGLCGFLNEIKPMFNTSSTGLPRTKIISGQG